MATKKNANFCELTEEATKRIKKFHRRQDTNVAALVLKINKDARTIEIEEEHEDITMDELQAELPISQPRFIVVSYVLHHSDGRKNYPQCVIHWTPTACPPDLHLLYSSSCIDLLNTIGINKKYEIRDVEDLTDEWMKEALTKV